MKKIIQIILLIVATGANGQSDLLIWKSDTLNFYSNPLEQKKNWNQFDQIITNRIEENKFGTNRDSLTEILPWRNYKTEWVIRNDSLYLTKIISLYSPEEELNLQRLFQTAQRLIFAEWVDENIITFDGTCIICTGNHRRNSSIYPNETVFRFQDGVLSGKTAYRNFISNKSKFSSANPNEYLDFVYGNINWNKIPDMGDKNYQVSISIKPKLNGKLKEIIWENSYLVVDDSIIQDRENIFIKEAIRIAKRLPDWDVVIRQDKILNQGITILFSEEMKEKYAG
ncbi:MAG TPA: hypothetical protein VLO29_01650 [Salegentibacter sp.]|nr:hypothetical protein [Salegentibacter sp.]